MRELTEIADKIVKAAARALAAAWARCEIVGGLERAINVWVDADRLAAYQIPITAVRDALARQNADVPGGNVTAGGREQTLRTMGRFADAARLQRPGRRHASTARPIRVRDIGRAEDGTKEQRSLARLNGVPTVTLEVRRQSGANTVEVIEGVKASLDRVQAAAARRT